MKALKTRRSGAVDKQSLTNAQKIEVIKGAKNLLGRKGKRWVKGVWFGIKTNGIGPHARVSVPPEDADCWCLLGALEESAFRLGYSTAREENDRFGTMTSLKNLVRKIPLEAQIWRPLFNRWETTFMDISHFNDDSRTTWEDIEVFLDKRLDQLKKAEQRRLAKKK